MLFPMCISATTCVQLMMSLAVPTARTSVGRPWMSVLVGIADNVAPVWQEAKALHLYSQISSLSWLLFLHIWWAQWKIGQQLLCPNYVDFLWLHSQLYKVIACFLSPLGNELWCIMCLILNCAAHIYRFFKIYVLSLWLNFFCWGNCWGRWHHRRTQNFTMDGPGQGSKGKAQVGVWGRSYLEAEAKCDIV